MAAILQRKEKAVKVVKATRKGKREAETRTSRLLPTKIIRGYAIGIRPSLMEERPALKGKSAHSSTKSAKMKAEHEVQLGGPRWDKLNHKRIKFNREAF